MGSAATKAKARWNASRYRQVKVSVAPEIAEAFKCACEMADVSMAGELSRFMSDYCAVASGKKHKITDEDNLSTRRKRKKAVIDITKRMERLLDAEINCHDNVPENLRGASAYEETEDIISTIGEVIALLETIY